MIKLMTILKENLKEQFGSLLLAFEIDHKRYDNHTHFGTFLIIIDFFE
jgi:hypothetical protein